MTKDLHEDDGEPITAEWWKQQDGIDKHDGALTLTTFIQIVLVKYLRGFEMELVLSDEEESVCVPLPAVRTRGDVRQLVRLLGREL